MLIAKLKICWCNDCFLFEFSLRLRYMIEKIGMSQYRFLQEHTALKFLPSPWDVALNHRPTREEQPNFNWLRWSRRWPSGYKKAQKLCIVSDVSLIFKQMRNASTSKNHVLGNFYDVPCFTSISNANNTTLHACNTEKCPVDLSNQGFFQLQDHPLRPKPRCHCPRPPKRLPRWRRRRPRQRLRRKVVVSFEKKLPLQKLFLGFEVWKDLVFWVEISGHPQHALNFVLFFK